MKIAAMILGILGGIAGLGSAVIVLFLGGLGGALGANGADSISSMGVAAIPFSILGIVGGAMASTKSKAAALMMGLSAVGGTIVISMAYIIAGPLLLVGCILAYLSSREEKVQLKTAVDLLAENIDADIVANSTSSKTAWYRRKGVIIVSGIFIVLMTIGGVAKLGTSQSESGQKPIEEYPYQVNVKGIGLIKGVVLDDMGFAISGVAHTSAVGNSFSLKRAQGEFVVLDIVVTNQQKEATTLSNSMFKCERQ